MGLEMSAQDLNELYQLTRMYYECYGSEHAAAIMAEVRTRYAARMHGQDVSKATNPRGAGRKKKYDEQMDQRVLTLRKEGRSIPEIARETGCSAGYVHSVIHRQ